MIPIKTSEEIRIMSEGGRRLAQIMEELKKMIRIGITTNELNLAAEDLISKFGGEPSFKGYKVSKHAKLFPAALCTSINEVVVHSVPSQRMLKSGDILSLDIGMKYKGYHADMAATVPVGEISSQAARLLYVTKESLGRAISVSRPGNTFGDIGYVVQKYVESQGFGVVRELCGHGIGKQLHQPPQILNYGRKGTGPMIKAGMVFCIEPMVTVGSWRLKQSKDGFGFETIDGSLSCHFEHMIAVTAQGPKILTKLA